MTISVHRQPDMAIGGQGLGRLGSDVGPPEIGDERVPQGMEISKADLRILVL